MGFNSGFKGLKLSAKEKIWTRTVGATDGVGGGIVCSENINNSYI